MDTTFMDETKGHVMFRLGVAMCVLSTLSIVLRFWARLARENISVGWDDWLAVCAWACCTCDCAFMIKAVDLGMGRHVATISNMADLSTMLELVYVSEILFDAGITFAKLSALCFYLRVFTVRSRRFKWCFGVTVFLVVAYAAYKLPLQIAECIPPRKFWEPQTPGHCTNGYTNLGHLLCGLIWDAVTDFMILILPMPIISTLHMPRGRRASIIITFFCGYLAWVLSFGRMGASIVARPILNTPDFTWNLPSVLEWSLAEIAISIFSICIPTWLYLPRQHYKSFNALLVSIRHGGVYLRRLVSNDSAPRGASDTNLVQQKGQSDEDFQNV